jgi:hypothetical protein
VPIAFALMRPSDGGDVPPSVRSEQLGDVLRHQRQRRAALGVEILDLLPIVRSSRCARLQAQRRCTSRARPGFHCIWFADARLRAA